MIKRSFHRKCKHALMCLDIKNHSNDISDSVCFFALVN